MKGEKKMSNVVEMLKEAVRILEEKEKKESLVKLLQLLI